MTAQATIDTALLRAEWQPTLFGQPNRARLADCALERPSREFCVRVHRNHAIEPVTSAAAVYAAWNGLAYAWSIGSYDDSLSFDLNGAADVEVVWFDMARLPGLAAHERAEWLISRMRALRAATVNPVIVAAWPLEAWDREALERAKLVATYCADLDSLAVKLGARWLDSRTELFSGTRFSNLACLHIARALACQWLPASLIAPIKCIALDLDGTLYGGVLGEDGAEGVQLSRGHRALQEYLAASRRNGVLLALVSRNERADVEALFDRRDDFPLRLDDFSAVETSWDDKATALMRVAKRLRIGSDAIAFVDDNPGELASVAAAGGITTVHARPDAEETLAALGHVAGLFRWRVNAEDRLRAGDLRAAAERDQAASANVCADDYLRSLAVKLRFCLGERKSVARAADLVCKTNQFNLSLRRMNDAEIAQRIERDPRNVVLIALSDRLSDSGIIGVLVGTSDDDTLRLEEVSLSCRALGRRLEDTMLTRALMLMAEGRQPRQITFDVREGARNTPAREWLAAFAGMHWSPDSSSVSIPFAVLAGKSVSTAVTEEITVTDALA